jgi:ElaA protein
MKIYTHTFKHFNELTATELYSFIRLRNEVFVVEQNCIYQDTDNKDILCHHLMLFQEKDLIGYARLVPAGLTFTEISIGRVVTSPLARGTGAGKVLMQLAIEYCYKLYGYKNIRISAQFYARSFYAQVGFIETGTVYLEDDIEHISMVRLNEA